MVDRDLAQPPGEGGRGTDADRLPEIQPGENFAPRAGRPIEPPGDRRRPGLATRLPQQEGQRRHGCPGREPNEGDAPPGGYFPQHVEPQAGHQQHRGRDDAPSQGHARADRPLPASGRAKSFREGG